MRRFLRATLTSNGYDVLEAGTAQEGIKQIGLRHPDLIILDLGLPDMDGLEVTTPASGMDEYADCGAFRPRP